MAQKIQFLELGETLQFPTVSNWAAGIPLMLSVLADVGGIFAGLLQLTWGRNKTRVRQLAEKLHIISQR